MSATFDTIRSRAKKKTSSPSARLMGFREFCEYVYDPLTKAKDLSLSEAERKAILESVEERCLSIPKRLK